MVPLDILIFGNLGIALGAGSAATVNHIVDDWRVDSVMARTHNRPIAQGRQPAADVTFAPLSVFGMGMLVLLMIVITAMERRWPSSVEHALISIRG